MIVLANGKQNIKRWATDVIADDYKEWNEDVVLLGLGTGRGKTTFSLNTYCKYLKDIGKSVLFLCNRKKLKTQISLSISGYEIGENVTLESYQKLQELLKAGESIPTYDVYICDEAHFFLSDSEFNLYTDVSYEYLMKQTRSTVVFMTATYQSIFFRIKEDIVKRKSILEKYKPPKMYILPTDYSYVDKIYWFRNSDLYGVVDTILRETDDKILYFCNGITKMQKFYNHYSPDAGTENSRKYSDETNLKHMDFFCSDYANRPFAKKFSNKEAIVKSEDGGFKFNKRVLVSTKCIDNGVDFKDRKLKHIICDIFDLESAIQCLGRKRILDENDTCIFYIRDYQSYELNLFYRNVIEQLEPAKLFEQDRPSWITKYGKDRTYKDYTIYFDHDLTGEWKLNPLRYSKLKQDQKLIKDMIDKKISYKEKIVEYLGESVLGKSTEISEIENDKIRDAIEIFLDVNMNQKLDKEKQNELIELCGLKDRFGRSQKSIGIISKYLQDNYLCKIRSKVSKKKGMSVRNWIINKLS